MRIQFGENYGLPAVRYQLNSRIFRAFTRSGYNIKCVKSIRRSTMYTIFQWISKISFQPINFGKVVGKKLNHVFHSNFPFLFICCSSMYSADLFASIIFHVRESGYFTLKVIVWPYWNFYFGAVPIQCDTTDLRNDPDYICDSLLTYEHKIFKKFYRRHMYTVEWSCALFRKNKHLFIDSHHEIKTNLSLSPVGLLLSSSILLNVFIQLNWWHISSLSRFNFLFNKFGNYIVIHYKNLESCLTARTKMY